MKQLNSSLRYIAKSISSAFVRLILITITGYQKFISPLTPSSCRFLPTCSCFAKQAVHRHGPLIGGWLSFLRLFRCNPLTEPKYDPVPISKTFNCMLRKRKL